MRSSHFAGLDGLRGIAALAVVTLHLQAVFLFNEQLPPLPASLAVDFFFMLSGFVLAYAYAERLREGLSFGRFMLIRWVRLYPMLFLGLTAAGVIAAGKYVLQGEVGAGQSPLSFLASFSLLPIGVIERWLGLPYPPGNPFLFNGPIWSLTYEFIGSALFALGGFALRGRIGGLLLLLTAVTWTVLVASHGSVSEFGLRQDLLAEGMVRLILPFLIGILIFNSGAFRHIRRLPIVLPMVGLAVVLWAPVREGALIDWVSLFLFFPFLLLLGASAQPSGRLLALCNWLGAVSYPLYLLHLPTSRMAAFVAKPFVQDLRVLFVIGFAGCLLSSWLALKLFDEPVRRWLGGRIKRPQSAP